LVTPASRVIQPPKKPKLIASDLDGTLFNRAEMSARTWKAVQAVQEAGIRFVAATGRATSLLGPLEAHGFDGIAVCDNGAITYDVGRDHVIGCQLIEAELVGELVREFSRRAPDIHLGVSRITPHNRAMYSDPKLLEFYSFGQEPLELSEFGDEPAGKLFALHRGMDSIQIAREFADLTDGRVAVSWSANASGLIEITADGVTKEFGLAALARRWRIDAIDVVAIGDGNNDLEMLAWAGKAVVPENGSDSAKMLANEVIGPITEDGTAIYLESLLD